MKEFDHHESCPECGSGDNVGVWTDGQKWCFGCGYMVKGPDESSIERMKTKVSQSQQEEKTPNDIPGLSLPSDYSHNLDLRATKWLMKYGIKREEVIQNRFGWSDKYESLIFPIFDLHNNLLLVQRRFFGDGDWPKYHTKGSPESVIHILGDRDSDTGVLVEDLLSAIKVGRQVEASPLWGSNLSLQKIERLAHRFQRLILWLDRDKAKEAVKFKWKAQPFFEKVSIIVSELDPKEYNDEAIATYLSPNL